MNIELFELEDGMVKPTVHCYNIGFLKKIIEEYPNNFIKVFSYLFYVTCKNKQNPYFNRPELDLEDEVLEDIEADFSTEDSAIRYAKARLTEFYTTPTMRAYNAMKAMLDKLSTYLETEEITHGRDGNITAIVNAAKNFHQLKKSFDGIANDMEEESQSRARGGADLAYDQM